MLQWWWEAGCWCMEVALAVGGSWATYGAWTS